MGQHEWTQLELGTVYLGRILSSKTTVSVVWSRTSGCFPCALITQLWNYATFLSLCLPCWQKGTSLFSYCFELLMSLQNLKCLQFIVSTVWKDLFNLLYLISLWYNFLNQSLWGTNKNKTPERVRLFQSLLPPSSHRVIKPLGILVGINMHLRCWTTCAHLLFCLDLKCFSETHGEGLVLIVAVLRGDWIRWSYLLTRWIHLWIDTLMVSRAGTVMNTSSHSPWCPPRTPTFLSTRKWVDLLFHGLPDVLPYQTWPNQLGQMYVEWIQWNCESKQTFSLSLDLSRRLGHGNGKLTHIPGDQVEGRWGFILNWHLLPWNQHRAVVWCWSWFFR